MPGGSCPSNGRTLTVPSALRGSSGTSSSTRSSCACERGVRSGAGGAWQQSAAASFPPPPSAPPPRQRAPRRVGQRKRNTRHGVGVCQAGEMEARCARTTRRNSPRKALRSDTALPSAASTPTRAPPGQRRGRTPPWLADQTQASARRRCRRRRGQARPTARTAAARRGGVVAAPTAPAGWLGLVSGMAPGKTRGRRCE